MSTVTPIYQLPYLQQGDPARLLRKFGEDLAKATEAALKTKALAPPAAQDLAALAGRVTTLEYDSGVLPLAPLLAAGWVVGGDGATYRKYGKTVDFQAHLVRNSGGTFPLAGTLMTLPAGFRPAAMHWWAALKFGGSPGEFKVQPTGVVSFGLAVEQGSGCVLSGSWLVP